MSGAEEIAVGCECHCCCWMADERGGVEVNDVRLCGSGFVHMTSLERGRLEIKKIYVFRIDTGY